MFICTEWIEETGSPPGLIFGMWGYFWPVGIFLACGDIFGLAGTSSSF